MSTTLHCMACQTVPVVVVVLLQATAQCLGRTSLKFQTGSDFWRWLLPLPDGVDLRRLHRRPPTSTSPTLPLPLVYSPVEPPFPPQSLSPPVRTAVPPSDPSLLPIRASDLPSTSDCPLSVVRPRTEAGDRRGFTTPLDLFPAVALAPVPLRQDVVRRCDFSDRSEGKSSRGRPEQQWCSDQLFRCWRRPDVQPDPPCSRLDQGR